MYKRRGRIHDLIFVPFTELSLLLYTINMSAQTMFEASNSFRSPLSCSEDLLDDVLENSDSRGSITWVENVDHGKENGDGLPKSIHDFSDELDDVTYKDDTVLAPKTGLKEKYLGRQFSTYACGLLVRNRYSEFNPRMLMT